MGKRESCRAEIMAIIGYEIEVGSIIRVRKRDELPITLVVTKVSRGWYQGLKLICEDLSKADIILQKGKDILYVMPSGYAQYVGIETSLIKGIRKTDCVGAEGFIVGKVVNIEVLNSILKLAKAEVAELKETNISKKAVLNFEEVVKDAKDKFELIKMLRLDKVQLLKKAVMAVMEKRTGSMKPILSEVQKYRNIKNSELKRELNAELAIWIAEENVKIVESALSYFFQRIAEIAE